MGEKVHKSNETPTERRSLTRSRLERVLAAEPGDSLTSDLNLGWSLRALGPGQLRMLNLLLQVFEQHPRTQDEISIIEHMTNNLLREVGK